MELKHFFAQDIEGNVIPNATVYVYEAGGTTIATGLEDKDGNPLPVPFYANEDGLIQFAAPDGVYDMRVVDGLRDYTLKVQAFDANLVRTINVDSMTKLDEMNSSALMDGQTVSIQGSIFTRSAGQWRLDSLLTAGAFGILGNGEDETKRVQAAMDYLGEIGGGTLDISGRHITLLGKINGHSNTRLYGGGTGVLDFSQRTEPVNGDQALVTFRGTSSPVILLTQDAVYGQNAIHVHDASQFKEGDLVEVSMNDEGSYPDTSVGVKSGQLNIVQQVDVSNNRIILDTIIYELKGYSVANGARVRIVEHPVENIIIEGLRVIGGGRPVENSGGDLGIGIFFGRNVSVRDCVMERCDGKSIEVISCYHASIENNEVYLDKIGTTNSKVSYGISYSSSYFVDITHNKVVNARHGIISSHLSSSLDNKYYGVSRFINIEGNFITGNYGDLSSSGYSSSHAGIATHTDVEHLKIKGNTVSGCYLGINPRTWFIDIEGNTIEGCKSHGIYLSGSFHNLLFKNNVVRECGSFLGFQSSTSENQHDNLVFEGNHFVSSNGVFSIAFSEDIETGISRGFVFKGNVVAGSRYTGSYNAVTILGRVSGIIEGNILYDNASGDLRVERATGLYITDNRMEGGVSIQETDKTWLINNLAGSVGLSKGNTNMLVEGNNVKKLILNDPSNHSNFFSGNTILG
ncbi:MULTISPECIES: right-handed parallel beta-helix repeat-containing protein [unclassified Halomonas]|uniref:right-handed parallel beta-helix repeat-containing protein n=1 Tax=unclassified Halomonas TaxID=2609666 RepID=UPI0028856D40|nr:MULTISPECIES: right-handed parallel beta-helix repeat-containing protein [unclassified Halomonas]MDT0501906.1 right-handed parallel beta-helix repeat-containing protein [Halomonas sp. PAR7]MDT0511005.1 right-handed parallel beta-helix repeat-containing protein [Halomonas sp. LES1]MDT0592478.1 right-handed parallel beta-helix repeat-containing protein [Halomonas sp. PAR8]